ncbi:hypothetical protein PV325_001597 [Microctonus aethiopoides]|uniref:Uncharacterized protein n=1 Tax=Microctonus aethiopoides TaxID=144406 RepID=A0AA39FW52_9HYME|nr:hypothetical protein PV325_001597 [Microctonus aethiopoides]KAK0091282.1 hypothetical protein PV326_003465 [Microctonus aethiopoides]KAK0176954.1 hypothetical protein PV328_001052 [Microctonus aethiopoides]
MDIGVNIAEDFSPEEINFMKFVPPYSRNYDAVLEKIFGNKAGPEAYKFRRDLIEFHDSEVQELSEEKIANNAVNGSQGIVVSTAGVNDDDDDDEGYDIAGNEYPISLHYKKRKNGEDVSCSATVAIDEKKKYTIKDLIIHMMNERILKDVAYIYVKGSEKKQWLSDIISGSKTNINLENLGCPSMKNIGITSCHYHEYRKSNLMYHCAFENVKQLERWIEKKTQMQNPSIGRSLELYYQLEERIEDMKPQDIAYFTKEFILKFAPMKIDRI